MYSMARWMVEKRQYEKGDDEDEMHGFSSRQSYVRVVCSLSNRDPRVVCPKFGHLLYTVMLLAVSCTDYHHIAH
jgi:hypothetical protein